MRLSHLFLFPRRFGRREVFFRRQSFFCAKRIYNLEGDRRWFEQAVSSFPDHRNRICGGRRRPPKAGQLESGRDDRNLLFRRYFPDEVLVRIAVFQRLQVIFELRFDRSRQNGTLGSLPLEFRIKGSFGRCCVEWRTHLERGSVLTYHQISTTTHDKVKSERRVCIFLTIFIVNWNFSDI